MIIFLYIHGQLQNNFFLKYIVYYIRRYFLTAVAIPTGHFLLWRHLSNAEPRALPGNPRECLCLRNVSWLFLFCIFMMQDTLKIPISSWTKIVDPISNFRVLAYHYWTSYLSYFNPNKSIFKKRSLSLNFYS